MQKRKLDLNHLLAKYEGVSQTAYGSPLRQKNQDLIEEEFYQYPQQSRTYQDPHPLPDRPVMAQQSQQSRTVTGNFSMSKSEIEAFLMSLREDIRGEERAVNKQVESSLKVVLQNFQRSHEKLRRELLEILDRSFAENEKMIRQELSRQSKTQSPEFSGVYRKITSLDQEIDRYLNGLRGAEYRRTIAEVVTRDFQSEINELHALAGSAKNSFIQSLGEVEYERTRVETIRENMQKLFFINKVRSGSPVTNPHIHDVGGSIFSIVKERITEPPVAQSRTRKSFFNFGGD